MSEEEKNIIVLKQRAEEMLKNDYSRKIGDEEIYTIICEWEKTLDLYKKEKEKRIELENKIAKRQWVKVKENGEVEPLFYISKDKIRKKIRQLEALDKQYYKKVIVILEKMLGE